MNESKGRCRLIGDVQVEHASDTIPLVQAQCEIQIVNQESQVANALNRTTLELLNTTSNADLSRFSASI